MSAMKLVVPMLLLATGVASAQTPHPCATDAVAKAPLLLKLHVDDAELAKSAAIDQVVKVLPPVKALKGSGRFDVLEVRAHIYKAEYRMRFLYAQIKGSCLVMGQEIIEASDPY
jgi:hypothetical protein